MAERFGKAIAIVLAMVAAYFWGSARPIENFPKGGVHLLFIALILVAGVLGTLMVLSDDKTSRTWTAVLLAIVAIAVVVVAIRNWPAAQSSFWAYWAIIPVLLGGMLASKAFKNE